MKQVMQQSVMGFVPDTRYFGQDFDFSKMNAGDLKQILPPGMVPQNGFKPGQIPSTHLPPGMELPKGMILPPENTVRFDATNFNFTGADGRPFDIGMAIDPEAMKGKFRDAAIPQLADGRFVPVPVMGQQPPINTLPGFRPQLVGVMGFDPTQAGVDKSLFTNRVAGLAPNQITGMDKGSLDALYNSMTVDRVNIMDPQVQQKMDLIFQERNKALSLGDINGKLRALNQFRPEVVNINTETLAAQMQSLQDMKAKGIPDPQMAEKVDDAIAKMLQAQATQLEIKATNQQIAELMEIKNRLMEQSAKIRTEVFASGFIFTPTEHNQVQEELAAAGGDKAIQSLIARYSAQFAGDLQAKPEIAIKLAALYEKNQEDQQAQLILSQALSKNPGDDRLALELAQLYSESNDLNRAVALLQDAVKREPLPQTEAKLAEVLFDLGKPKDAVVYIENAIAGLNNMPAVYDQANEIYLAAGDTEDVKTFIDGEKFHPESQPSLEEGNVMMSGEDFAEAIGADAEFDPYSNKMVIQEGGRRIEITAGSNEALVNGVVREMEVAARVENDEMVFPANFVGENLNKQVTFKTESNMLIIE